MTMTVETCELYTENTILDVFKANDEQEMIILGEVVAGNFNYKPIQDAVVKIEEVVQRRLKKIAGEKNLFMYDGTLLDRLCLFFGKKYLGNKIDVLYSVRSCMDDQLILEVKNAAKCSKKRVVDFEKDCIVHNDHGFIRSSCCNVSLHIKETLYRSGGTLVLSSVLNSDNIDDYHRINNLLKTFTSIQDGFTRNKKEVHDWKNLFLFEGFHTIELFVAALVFNVGGITTHHIPLCYHFCHNEREQIKLHKFVKLYEEHNIGR